MGANGLSSGSTSDVNILLENEIDRGRRPVLWRRPLIWFLLAVTAVTGASAQSLETLAGQIRTGNVEQKRNALSEIRNLRTDAASRIAIPALSDPDEIVRSMAAAALVYLPPDESSRLLIPLLNDKAEFVRRETAFALGEIRSAVATPHLVETLQRDRSDIVRSAAAAALGKIGDALGVDALVAVLRKKPGSKDEYLRRSAARSLGQIAESVRGVTGQSATPQSFLPEKLKRSIASRSATSLVPAFSSAVGVLLKVGSNPKESDDTRREAAYALGSIGDGSAVAFLKANLTNGDNYMAEICREALLKMPKPE